MNAHLANLDPRRLVYASTVQYLTADQFGSAVRQGRGFCRNGSHYILEVDAHGNVRVYFVLIISEH